MIALRKEISSTEKKLFLKPRANNLQSTVRTESELRKRASNCQFQLYQQKRRHHHQLAALLEEFCSSAWKHVLIDLTHARGAPREFDIQPRVAVSLESESVRERVWQATHVFFGRSLASRSGIWRVKQLVDALLEHPLIASITSGAAAR